MKVAALLIPCALLLSAPGGATAGADTAGDYSTDARLSSLLHGCSLRYGEGPVSRRLWLECGCATFLVTDVNNLVGHVRIDTPERALELLRLFSGPGACMLGPDQPWAEVRAAEGNGWLSLSRARFDDLCPAVEVRESTTATSGQRVFDVRQCLLSSLDGHLHDVTRRVLEDGRVTVLEERVVLEDARAVVGSCRLLDRP